MKETIDFCSYRFPADNIVVVNLTDQLLRMKNPDGKDIVEIPSSVLPKGRIPEAYKAKAKELGVKVKKVCDSSLFVNVERCFLESKTFIHREFFRRKNGPDGMLVDSKVYKHFGYGMNIILVGTHNAARAYPRYLVEAVPDDDEKGIIRCDKFIGYELQVEDL